MADIFNSKPGALIKVPISGGAAILTLPGLLGNSLILGTTGSIDRVQDVEYQKSLTGLIYAYAFGEGVGKLQVGGMIFFGGGCGSGIGGLDAVNSYYEQNNIYVRPSPIAIGFGGVSLSGHLESMTISLESSEFSYGSFSLSFSRLPDKNK